MSWLKALGLVGLAVSMTSCVPDWASENETGLLMEIARITTSAGGQGGEDGDILLSDVSPDFNDDAIVTVNVYRKNPQVTATSALEHVRLESYEVRYFRTDGHSVEGVDVPHRITGALNSIRFHTPTETDEVEADATITIVRQQAKHEAPLANLVGVFPGDTGSLLVPGVGLVTTVAEITVYARQVTTGEPLSATGRVQVTFGDFANAQ
jgi:hypothetical protein